MTTRYAFGLVPLRRWWVLAAVVVMAVVAGLAVSMRPAAASHWSVSDGECIRAVPRNPVSGGCDAAIVIKSSTGAVLVTARFYAWSDWTRISNHSGGAVRWYLDPASEIDHRTGVVANGRCVDNGYAGGVYDGCIHVGGANIQDGVKVLLRVCVTTDHSVCSGWVPGRA